MDMWGFSMISYGRIFRVLDTDIEFTGKARTVVGKKLELLKGLKGLPNTKEGCGLYCFAPSTFRRVVHQRSKYSGLILDFRDIIRHQRLL
jgi:hypothetical protein